MVSITGMFFINIFEMKNYSALKFAMGYEKNRNFLVAPKSPKVWKKLKKKKKQTGLL